MAARSVECSREVPAWVPVLTLSCIGTRPRAPFIARMRTAPAGGLPVDLRTTRAGGV
ncbi:hypothetical protein [Corallococcus interemptor]|uniref:hypothetical protein n=1 Tax=Corallococcus interemptor TaxID=2316720 RepID=UPI001315962B|nr:hypothetical protein [Corallococcus interemptor]